MSDSILMVEKYFHDGEGQEVLIKCPHCGTVRGVRDEDFKGEQFTDNMCGRDFEISIDAEETKHYEDIESLEVPLTVMIQ